jgi:hypothetical protein
VRAADAVLCEEFVETVRRTLRCTVGHVEAQRTKAWCGHRDEQRSFALSAREKIADSRVHEILSRQILSLLTHPLIVEGRES